MVEKVGRLLYVLCEMTDANKNDGQSTQEKSCPQVKVKEYHISVVVKDTLTDRVAKVVLSKREKCVSSMGAYDFLKALSFFSAHCSPVN